MKKIIKVTEYHVDRRSQRVSFNAIVDGKKKYWSVAIGLFDVIMRLEEVEDLSTNNS